ncbi:unnamed protein product [Hermetia illucens]|uniref:Uncharacterized protein n=1 Tax=Hermetia illucens TaxID=343691 RepID=A0A7R8UKU6_HERIL|nr:pupal cuticle protein C1B-like [Hermetia illucens]CAD7082691.1 unnamed protein product [Hermetia illucens]
MFKTVILFAVIACAFAKPGVIAPLAYSAPVVAAAPGIVTASSSQVVARNYNGLAAPLVAAAAPVAYTAPAVAAYSAPLAYTAAAAPVAYAAGIAPAVAAPLKYTAAAPLLL